MTNREYIFYVYILANRSRNLYIGITSNIVARVLQHRELRPNTTPQWLYPAETLNDPRWLEIQALARYFVATFEK